MPGPGRVALNALGALAGFGGRGGRGGLLTTGLVGLGMIGAGKALNAISDTPWGREQAPITRGIMGLGAAGLTVSGYLAIGRGALGSAQAGYDRLFGTNVGRLGAFGARAPARAGAMAGSNSGSYGMLGLGKERGFVGMRAKLAARGSRLGAVDNFITAGFNSAKNLFGGVTQTGSPLNRLLMHRDPVAQLARNGEFRSYGIVKSIAKMPFRIATGMVDVVARGIPNAARFMFGRSGGRSVGSLMSPTSIFSALPGANLFLNEGRAAMGSGVFGWAAASALANQYIINKGNQTSGWTGTPDQFNPANYGQGFYAMREGPAANYGPALTLALHANSGRVMP